MGSAFAPVTRWRKWHASIDDRGRDDYLYHMEDWPPNGLTDAPIYRADIALWSSQDWWILGERAFSLCVIGARSERLLDATHNAAARAGLALYSVDEALSDVTSLEIAREVDLAEFGGRLPAALGPR